MAVPIIFIRFVGVIVNALVKVTIVVRYIVVFVDISIFATQTAIEHFTSMAHVPIVVVVLSK